jgi:hypothetical protein
MLARSISGFRSKPVVFKRWNSTKLNSEKIKQYQLLVIDVIDQEKKQWGSGGIGAVVALSGSGLGLSLGFGAGFQFYALVPLACMGGIYLEQSLADRYGKMIEGLDQQKVKFILESDKAQTQDQLNQTIQQTLNSKVAAEVVSRMVSNDTSIAPVSKSV